MRRPLFTFCTVLSLLLCLAVCLLRVRSETRHDAAETWRIRREADGGVSAVWFELSSSERLWFRMSSARLGRRGDPGFDSYYERADRSGGRWGFASLDWPRRRQLDELWGGPGYKASGWGPVWWKRWTQVNPTVPFIQFNLNIGVSHALIAALLAILPAWAYVRYFVRWHRGRSRRGLCLSCGYDLRATPERCPECGAIPATHPSADPAQVIAE